MRSILIWLIAISANAVEFPQVDKIVDAIYIAEGGTKTRFPYGIKSIKTKGVDHARRICRNTVERAGREWVTVGHRRVPDFIEYLAMRYCPKESDPVGHTNWVRNVRKLVTVKSSNSRRRY